MNNSINTKNKFEKHIQLSYWLCPIVIHCYSTVHNITRNIANVTLRPIELQIVFLIEVIFYKLPSCFAFLRLLFFSCAMYNTGSS